MFGATVETDALYPKSKYIEFENILIQPLDSGDTDKTKLKYPFKDSESTGISEDKATMLGAKDHVFMRSRRVMCHKGDHLEPGMRARLVTYEENKEGRNNLFHASTPPLGQETAVRQICLRACT